MASCTVGFNPNLGFLKCPANSMNLPYPVILQNLLNPQNLRWSISPAASSKTGLIDTYVFVVNTYPDRGQSFVKIWFTEKCCTFPTNIWIMSEHNGPVIKAYQKKYIVLPYNRVYGTFPNGIDFIGCYIMEDYAENAARFLLNEQTVMNNKALTKSSVATSIASCFGKNLVPNMERKLVPNNVVPRHIIQEVVLYKPVWWNKFVKILIHSAQKINRKNAKKQRLERDRLDKERLAQERFDAERDRIRCLEEAEQILKAEKEKIRIRSLLENHIKIHIGRLKAENDKLLVEKKKLAKAEKERLKEKAKKLAKKEQKVLELENTMMANEDALSNKHRIFFQNTLEKIPFEDGLIIKIFKDFGLDPKYLCTKSELLSAEDTETWSSYCEIIYILNHLIRIIFYCYLRENRYIKIPANLCLDNIYICKIIIYNKISVKNRDILKLNRPPDSDVHPSFRPFLYSIIDIYSYTYDFITQREMPKNVLEQVSLELSLYIHSKIFDEKGSLRISSLLRKKYPAEVFQSLVALAKAS